MNNNTLLLGWVTASASKNKNFGDELSPFIIKNITGYKVENVPVITNRFILLLMILKRILFFSRKNEILLFIKLLFGVKYTISTGSIIQFYRLNAPDIWGSGLISDNVKINTKSKVFAVRGPITRKILIEKGMLVPEIYGDPAILLPFLYQIEKKKQYECGFIPHKIHYEEFLNNIDVALQNKKINNKTTIIIDLATDEILDIIKKIASCSYVLSSSLHGIIVAHAYGVPALWCTLGSSPLLGNDVKFADYFLSVGIQPYFPFSLDTIFNYDSKLCRFFVENSQISMPQKDLKEIAVQLFNSAPFKVNNDIALKIK